MVGWDDWEVEKMACATCAKSGLVEIRMQINGSELMFRRCGHCDTQQWASPEGALELTEVLELARTR
jgi:hypothetical protein